ncbi:hypothetical protein EK904_002810, partial [Melospiza melodia maxima]
MKTVSVALVLCLNVGVDPPDVVKTTPCARLECWIDPLSMGPQKALETIGANLQKQYENWQPRAWQQASLAAHGDKAWSNGVGREMELLSVETPPISCKSVQCFISPEVPTLRGHQVIALDTSSPVGQEVMRSSQSHRGAAAIHTRVLWTALLLQSLDPTVDEVKKLCTSLRRNAKEERVLFHYNGHGVPRPTVNGEIWVFNKNYTQYIPLSIYDLQTWMGSPSIFVYDCSNAGLIVKSFKQFALQREQELEQQQTERVPVARLRFCMQKSVRLVPGVTLDLIEKIPGRLNDRRTPLGELNWIFTAITDTIAWNVLPRDLFQKLFRQDLLVASLFRNFLLAERIMRSYNCTPVSSPRLPPTYMHAMWIYQKKFHKNRTQRALFHVNPEHWQAWDLAVDICLSQLPTIIEEGTAFRALSVGIFPYVLKLLQSSARELRPLLVFIWAKILAVDSSCQADLVKDNGHKYFLSVLADPYMPAEHRTMTAFILAVIVNNYNTGQEACLQGNLIAICLEQLNDPHPLLRQWVAICLGRIWQNFDSARWCGVRDSAHEKLYSLLSDPIPEVRCAAVFALGTFVGNSAERTDHSTTIDHNVAMMLAQLINDGSPMVRKELVVALSHLVVQYESNFCTVALQFIEEEKNYPLPSPAAPAGSSVAFSPGNLSTSSSASSTLGSPENEEYILSFETIDKMRRVSSYSSLNSLIGVSFNSVYTQIWRVLLHLAADPYPDVSDLAMKVLNSIAYKATVNARPQRILDTSSLTQGSPPTTSTSSSSLTNEVPKPAVSRELQRPSVTNVGVQYTPHSHQFPRTRKMFDKGPEQTADDADDAVGHKSFISAAVQTGFCDWSAKYFAQPVMK